MQVLDVIHHLDIVEALINEGTRSPQEWAWVKQFRYYRTGRAGNAAVLVKMADAALEYSWEYQGNAPKLVYTPLTDRCYLTLTQVICCCPSCCLLHSYHTAANVQPAHEPVLLQSRAICLIPPHLAMCGLVKVMSFVTGGLQTSMTLSCFLLRAYKTAIACNAGHHFRVWRQPVWPCWYRQDRVCEGFGTGPGTTGAPLLLVPPLQAYRLITSVLSRPTTDASSCNSFMH